MSEESEDYRAELWAGRAPPDWERCSGCGEEWHIDDGDCCKCPTDAQPVMNSEQKQAVRCAYLDLVGAVEAVESGDPHAHDWKAVATTISEMISAFPTELEDLLDLARLLQVYVEIFHNKKQNNKP